MMGWEGSPSFSRVALNDFFFVRMCNVFQSPFCVILQYFLSPPFLSSPSFLFLAGIFHLLQFNSRTFI